MSRESLWRTSGMVRGSKTGPERAVTGQDGRAGAQIPASKACANITSVMWRYQPMKLRTRVLIQSHILAGCKIFFNMKACSNGPDHLWKPASSWCEHERVALLFGISNAAADEQKVATIILPRVQHRHNGPVEEPGSLGAFAHRETLPILFVEYPCFDQGGFFSSATQRSLEGNRLMAGHGQHLG
jgi:hypothetical protein